MKRWLIRMVGLLALGGPALAQAPFQIPIEGGQIEDTDISGTGLLSGARIPQAGTEHNFTSFRLDFHASLSSCGTIHFALPETYVSLDEIDIVMDAFTGGTDTDTIALAYGLECLNPGDIFNDITFLVGSLFNFTPASPATSMKTQVFRDDLTINETGCLGKSHGILRICRNNAGSNPDALHIVGVNIQYPCPGTGSAPCTVP